MRRLRVPDPFSSGAREIANLVRRYFASAEAQEVPLFGTKVTSSPQDVLLRIDAAVLNLYDLPANLERELLDLFAGWDRGGVPFRFDRYYPEHFKQAVHLREIVAATNDWAKTNRHRGRLIAREVEGTIREEEAAELKRLQGIASLRTDLLDPFNLEELEQIRAEIAIGTND